MDIKEIYKNLPREKLIEDATWIIYVVAKLKNKQLNLSNLIS